VVTIPKVILDLMNDKGTVKVLVTANAAGQPHAIVCGSFGIIDEDIITVGEIFMKRSSEYMAENNKVAIRNIRRDYIDLVKDSDDMTDDYKKRVQDEIQKVVDEMIGKIESIASTKEKEIMAI